MSEQCRKSKGLKARNETLIMKDHTHTHTPSTKIVKVNMIQYDMRQICSACVDQSLKLTKSTEKVLRKNAPTPYLSDEEKEYDETNEPKGQSQPIAAKVIMMMLYGARTARYDLLHSRVQNY